MKGSAGVAQLGLSFDGPLQPTPELPANDRACAIASEGRDVALAPRHRGRQPERPVPSPMLEEPGVIADRIVSELHNALAAGEGLRSGLRAEPDPEWVVFIALPPVDLDALPAPALVHAVGRYAAEGEVAAVVGIPASRCFALPAYAALRAGAVPLDAHPLRKVAPDALSAADAFSVAMQRQIDRVDEDMAETMAATARLMGCSVAELEARLATEKAERDAAAAARKVEAKGRRLPPPKNAPARHKSPGGPASMADGLRTITGRQRELLALVEVDQRTNRVVYTRDEHVPDWAALKQAVEALGGVYKTAGKKTRGGWTFPEGVDAMDAIWNALETGAIFDPKLLGFFPTSDELADELVAPLAIRPGDRVLEPSAGKGAIALAVRRACPEAEVVCVELVPEHQEELRGLGFQVIGGDFLETSAAALGGAFDVVAMNPPFGMGRPELRHLRCALSLLRSGGRLAAIMPASLQYRDDAPTVALRAELDAHGALITENPPGAFKNAGTMIRTVSLSLTRKT